MLEIILEKIAIVLLVWIPVSVVGGLLVAALCRELGGDEGEEP
jgi:hypothetical protein